jgi:hypothetical protein
MQTPAISDRSQLSSSQQVVEHRDHEQRVSFRAAVNSPRQRGQMQFLRSGAKSSRGIFSNSRQASTPSNDANIAVGFS